MKYCAKYPNAVVAIVLLLLYFVGSTSVAGQTIDVSFNADISTTRLAFKTVNHIVTLPDGKILAAGKFNNYNGSNVGGLIRLNSDATLDTTFNNFAFLSYAEIVGLWFGNDGKIYVNVYPTGIIRLEPNGTVDPTYSFAMPSGGSGKLTKDNQDRFVATGFFQVNRNGQLVTENVIRIANDGSLDLTFDAPPINNLEGTLIATGGRIYLSGQNGSEDKLYRLGPSGELEVNGASIGTGGGIQFAVQSDGKLLVKRPSTGIRRYDANGIADPSFQVFNFGQLGQPRDFFVGQDDRITLGYRTDNLVHRYLRLNSDGSPDASFLPYDYLGDIPTAATMANDGSLLIGDSSYTDSNRFTRVRSDGTFDTSFNVGGSGFLSYALGRIRAILPLPGNKVLVGGNFDRVNGVEAKNIARLNSDGSLDPTFQISVGAASNGFSTIDDVYSLALQPNGRILASGSFRYSVNSLVKDHVVRLNQDGAIDPSFNLGVYVMDYFSSSSLGRDRMVVDSSNRILVGTSAGTSSETDRVPLRLNQDGSRDMSFTSSVFASNTVAAIFDIQLQNDGKILISGRRDGSGQAYGFLMRLNSDASVDETFQPYQELSNRLVKFKLLPNGKILAVSTVPVATNSRVLLFNPDGSQDSSFATGAGSVGRINSIEVLDNGRILIGGLFTSYNGESRKNFAVLDSNGQVRDERIEPNGEVLCISIDGNGRVILGGIFTAIQEGGLQSMGRTYLARLRSLENGNRSVLFDYDGDGRSDLSVKRPKDKVWYLLRGTAGYTAQQFGEAGDRMAPADYDGDGKTDVAVFRPATGTWFVFASQTQTFQQFGWGANGDLPVPTDRDNDGKADLVVYRESNNTWYTRFANGTFATTQFGVAGDKPLVGDFDGDGIGDIALFRPSNNNWYLMKSSIGFFTQTWGEAGDIPVPADYDGDGATDQAVFRPSTGQWFLSRTTAGFGSQSWGQAGDIPVAADYDGDGKSDVAVFRPSNGTWYIVNSTAGQLIQQFGTTGDVPTQSAYLY